MNRLAMALAAMILATPALGAEPSAATEPAQPCKPDPSRTMQIAGYDPEMLRCQHAIMSGMLGEKDVLISELRANVMLGAEHLKAEVTAKAKLAAEYEGRLDEAMKWLKAAQDKPAAQMPAK